MGFYDCRCMASGVSLKGADAVAVLLQLSSGAFRPVALALTGSYDRLGTIGGVTDDANARLISAYFLAKRSSGEFVIDEPYWSKSRCPITNIENLLWGFERNTNDNPEAAVLNGAPVVAALTSRRVWDAIVRAAPHDERADSARFAALFSGVSVAEEMYRGHLARVGEQLRELSAVSAFLATRGIEWTPTEAGGQDYADEMRDCLASARERYKDCPAVLDGLRDYEREVSELLGSE